MKKLPTKYRLTVVDGKLMFSAPSDGQITQSKAPTVEISIPAPPTKECRQCKKEFASPKKLRGAPQMYCSKACRTVFNNRKYYVSKRPQKSACLGEVTCPQCETTFMWERRGRGGILGVDRDRPCAACGLAAKCREAFFNAKYKQERSERLAKTSPRTISCDHIAPAPAASQYIPCKECNNTFLKGRANQVFCKKDCRIGFFANKYLPEKVTGTFVEKVKKALATLPPEEKLPPIPEDTSAASLLAAGRTLTPLGLVEAVQNTYGVDVAEERPRPKAFWFSVLLARHSKTLEEWKNLLGKHGLVSNPKIEKWLLFRAGASSPATAGRLKAQLGI